MIKDSFAANLPHLVQLTCLILDVYVLCFSSHQALCMILTKGLKQYWGVSFWRDNTGSFASCSKMCVLYTWCWIWIVLTKVQKLEYTSCAKCCIRIPALWRFADRKFAAESMYTYMSCCGDHRVLLVCAVTTISS